VLLNHYSELNYTIPITNGGATANIKLVRVGSRVSMSLMSDVAIVVTNTGVLVIPINNATYYTPSSTVIMMALCSTANNSYMTGVNSNGMTISSSINTPGTSFSRSTTFTLYAQCWNWNL
jgi:hypothetical protein